MIYGFILIMVTILPSGDIESQALNWFADPIDCIEQGMWEEQNAPFGVGYVCVEDYVENGK